ncbi:MAG: pitrilysin family protein [Clostridia bacterium]|nr:pitrilysin family protein [Clostridia bacterium]
MNDKRLRKVESPRTGDYYYTCHHESGLEITIYPKTKFRTTYAIFGTHYGSIDSSFKRSDEESITNVPDGIAHYLEHKMFESEQGDAFERYAKTGANANAFTSFDKTCYLFSCAERVNENLEILLDFVQDPYFTAETVAKEQGIIGQEIKMYDDEPGWRVMFNMLECMYHNHPVKKDVCGTVESIAQITPELLYSCYNTFYNLNNMTLVLAGNVNPDEVLEICDRVLKKSEDVTIERIFEEEPDTIVKPYIEQKFSVAMPLFQFGFKENVSGGFQSEKDIATTEILLEIIASDASPLFLKLYNEELINEASFSYEFFEGDGFACTMFGGESRDPKRVAEEILREIKFLREEGISQDDFEVAKKSLYGANIQGLNSSSAIANSIVTLGFSGRELFRYIDSFAEITLEDVQNKLDELMREDRAVLSVILPSEELKSEGE